MIPVYGIILIWPSFRSLLTCHLYYKTKNALTLIPILRYMFVVIFSSIFNRKSMKLKSKATLLLLLAYACRTSLTTLLAMASEFPLQHPPCPDSSHLPRNTTGSGVRPRSLRRDGLPRHCLWLLGAGADGQQRHPGRAAPPGERCHWVSQAVCYLGTIFCIFITLTFSYFIYLVWFHFVYSCSFLYFFPLLFICNRKFARVFSTGSFLWRWSHPFASINFIRRLRTSVLVKEVYLPNLMSLNAYPLF